MKIHNIHYYITPKRPCLPRFIFLMLKKKIYFIELQKSLLVILYILFSFYAILKTYIMDIYRKSVETLTEPKNKKLTYLKIFSTTTHVFVRFLRFWVLQSRKSLFYQFFMENVLHYSIFEACIVGKSSNITGETQKKNCHFHKIINYYCFLSDFQIFWLHKITIIYSISLT